MTGQPRPAISALPGYRPGRSAAAAAADHGVTDAIKLASNEAPFGPLPTVAAEISSGVATVNLYPDHRAGALRADLAAQLDVDIEQVTVGAGSAGLLQQILLAYVSPGDPVAMCWPSFEAYPLFAQLVEAEQVRVPLRDEIFDLAGLADAVDEHTRVAFVTNPNNPTGTVVGTEDIAAFLRSVPASCIVVLDEAYSEFVTDPRVTDSTRLLRDFSNLVITRTFSKAHGLAALRVGYAVGHPEVIAMIDRTLVPFAVNDLAQRGARASLSAVDEMEIRVGAVVAERHRLTVALRDLGWKVPEPQGNFIWMPLRSASTEIGIALERLGIVARVFDNVGVRVTVADPASNDRFLTALTHAARDVGIDPQESPPS